MPLNTFSFSCHEIDLVLSVFRFSPFCLQEHPILFRSLLMALNKYTFWDLTEPAVLLQTTSKVACLKPKADMRHVLAYSSWPGLIPRSLLSTTTCLGQRYPALATRSASGELSEFLRPHPRQIPSNLQVGSWHQPYLKSCPGDCSKQPC